MIRGWLKKGVSVGNQAFFMPDDISRDVFQGGVCTQSGYDMLRQDGMFTISVPYCEIPAESHGLVMNPFFWRAKNGGIRLSDIGSTRMNSWRPNPGSPNAKQKK